ncbi:MarR family winged helix-turn-helix transcriptional regulator [Maricaulis salignorans]|uniref:DNA-binding transcriptional regulator, MarR family n=1 Tax=Maricaulis salignorans TaxID=144026 RepID=A0A1G9RI69_9PROT|nr:MarR family winged helix-turn-helix transcriptional regulator [Maricaulis salignorans]SDM22145.1 DNA-binding transcriptional regulator, MarR family [Maricaulis salignorans]
MARIRAVDRRLFLLIEIAARRLNRDADARLKAEAGVTSAQAAVLFLLARRGERRMGEIGDTLSLNPPAVTGLVSRMEALGLVRKTASKTDGRSAVVSLTEKGRALGDAADISLRGLNTELETRLGEDDSDTLHRVLTRLATEA